MKVDVAGLKIDAITKQELLAQLKERIKNREQTFITTPYSEFLYRALRRRSEMDTLNQADFAIADGVGILWAQAFMSQPLTWPGFYLKIFQGWLQVVWTGASILLWPAAIYKTIPEKIVGADLVWDLAKLATENNFAVYLLGAQGNIAELVAKKLQNKFQGLNIVGTSNKLHTDPSIVDDIKLSSADMIFVAFSPPAQEQWIAENLKKTGAVLGIGLGGTFDYIAGEKQAPPKFIRHIGLEWLYRLITQPSRISRIYRGFWGLIISLMRVKVYATTPLRVTATAIVVNKDGKIFLGKQTDRVTKKFNPDDKLFEQWQFPQGGLEPGEDLVAGAQRELKEETGITSVELIAVAKHRHQYIWPNALRPFLTSNYKNKGGDLATVFFKFNGSDDEIKLDQNELQGYRWVSPEEVDQLVPYFRKGHAQAVLAELAKLQV